MSRENKTTLISKEKVELFVNKLTQLTESKEIIWMKPSKLSLYGSFKKSSEWASKVQVLINTKDREICVIVNGQYFWLDVKESNYDNLTDMVLRSLEMPEVVFNWITNFLNEDSETSRSVKYSKVSLGARIGNFFNKYFGDLK